MKPQQGRHSGLERLSDHLPDAFGIEAIDHHPVEAGDGPYLTCGVAMESLDRDLRVQSPHHRPDQRRSVHLRLGARRFALYDEQIPGVVDRNVE